MPASAFTIDRLDERTRRDGECLVWTGANDGTFGYGRVWVKGRGSGRGCTINAHHWVWEQINGPVPTGMVVRHRCDNPPCVSIEHLELGTQADNARDRDERGRNANRRKDRCPKGHRYDEENTYVNPRTGHRLCRECGRVSHRVVK